MRLTLFFYFSRRFLGALASIFGIVLFLVFLFDSIEMLRRGGDASFGSLIQLSLLRAPSITAKALPFAVLLAAMWTYTRLARSSELVVTRAAGMSAWRAISPAIVSAVAMGVFAFAIYNPIAAAMYQRYEHDEARIFKGQTNLLSISAEGLWLRQGDADKQSVIHALHANSNGTVLRDVTVFQFDGDNFIGRIDADDGRLDDKAWRLTNAHVRILDPAAPDAVVATENVPVYQLETKLTAAQILDSFASPETISFWNLPRFIRTLEQSGFSARRHLLHFHTMLAAPLLFAAMVLIGGAFSMRHARFGGLGSMTLACTLTGFGFYFISDVTQALGSSGSIEPILAAWTPPLAATLLAASLLLHLEDG